MSKTPYQEVELIDRKLIESISFPEEDVLEDIDAIKLRSSKIHKATSLGNLEHKKVHIVFKDANSMKRVFTTIWLQLGDNIMLKERVKLPVKRIVDIVVE